MLFNFKNLTKIEKFGTVLTVISLISFSTLIYIYTYNKIIIGLFFGAVVLAILSQLINKKIGIFDIFFLLPYVSVFLYINKITYSSEHATFIMPLQLITLSGLYLTYGGRLFEKLWDKNRFGIKTHWKDLEQGEIKKLYNLLIIYGPFLLLLFHGLMTVLSIIPKLDQIMFLHHFTITIIFFIMYYNLIKLIKSKRFKFRKQLARYYFHIFIILFIFDSMLEQIKYFRSGYVDFIGIFVVIIFLYFSIRPRITPKCLKKNTKDKKIITKEEILKSLKLFNEKTDKLKELNFTKQLIGCGSGLRIKWEKNRGFSTFMKGPKGESIDAFILTYRYFIQDNETTSFRNLSEYYNASYISNKIKQKFNKARLELNKFLDEFVNITINRENLTNRKIQDVFIYGGYAHAEDNKKEIFDNWMSRLPINDLLKNKFINILGVILKFIIYVKNINNEVICKFENNKTKKFNLFITN